jgi:hypothetical protein
MISSLVVRTMCELMIHCEWIFAYDVRKAFSHLVLRLLVLCFNILSSHHTSISTS